MPISRDKLRAPYAALVRIKQDAEAALARVDESTS